MDEVPVGLMQFFRLVGQGRLEPDNPIDDGSHEVLRLGRPVESG